MGWRERLFATDEELGKRDDDHKPSPNGGISWVPRQKPAIRWKRILGLIGACACLWVFVRNIPVLSPARQRLNPYESISYSRPRPARAPIYAPSPASSPVEHDDSITASTPFSQDAKAAETVPHDFDGPVKFYALAASLHGIARTSGHRASNKNILFAASSLKSVANLLPLACEMASWNRNYVHVTIMGRDEMSLDDIKQINGATRNSCDIFWHDARPDYAVYSSNKRMEISVAGALGHVEAFMHPQAVITDDFEDEDVFFGRAIQRKAKALGQTHIKVPDPEALAWIARLEAASLRAWHAATIDIVVQAPRDTSGSIIRLLRSLESAAYAGFKPPRLTIELPAKLKQDTHDFLNDFKWPPQAHEDNGIGHELSLRRRIPDQHVSVDEASTHFIESFYPANTENSHVLVLSPQAELSRVYFYYLKYNLLEYRYSSVAEDDASDLFGISLDLPSVQLNGSSTLDPPQPKRRSDATASDRSDEDNGRISSFLWQAPNSNAALYFGDKWKELHSFITKRHAASLHPSTSKHHRDRRKSVSEQLPAWSEYTLDLMKSRGYYLLYPNLYSAASLDRSNSLVITHNDLYQPPDEFAHPAPVTSSSAPLPTASILDAGNDYLASRHISQPESSMHLNTESPLLQNFIALLPAAPLPKSVLDINASPGTASRSNDPLPDLPSLPILDYLGVPIDADELEERSQTFAVEYRLSAGGCSKALAEAKTQSLTEHSAEDLFCIDDDEYSIVEHHKIEVEPQAAPREPAPKAILRPEPVQRKQIVNEKTTSVEIGSRPKTDSPSVSITAPSMRGVDEASMTTSARYQDTVKTGTKVQPDAAKVNGKVPVVGKEEIELTDVQRAELNDWQAKQRKAGDAANDESRVAKAGDAKADGRGRAVREGPGEGRAVADNMPKRPVGGVLSPVREAADRAEGDSVTGARRPAADAPRAGHPGPKVAAQNDMPIDSAGRAGKAAEVEAAGREPRPRRAPLTQEREGSAVKHEPAARNAAIVEAELKERPDSPDWETVTTKGETRRRQDAVVADNKRTKGLEVKQNQAIVEKR
ncbi:MAG: hypothetical protein M1828_003434 [Chrysothrix sp. TS-e1954]|nr:MAG: hypothetical protein M1828_003434 [Chrysothrix sp. TS-e1954]